MKKHLSALLGLGLLLATASAFAQTISLKANIPFNFVVNGKTLPAGEYTVQSMGSERALSIRNSDQAAKSLVLANACESMRPVDRTKLVFRRYGDQYFLARVWIGGNTSGQEIPASKQEAELAARYSAPETVSVAALR
jgi:hypothetical protein